jgi:hypothetical protein
VDMDGYADFVHENVQHCPVEVPSPENASKSALTLDLGRRGQIEILLSPKAATNPGQRNLIGQGNLTIENKTEMLEVTASLEGSKLSLDIRTLSGDLYSFNLAKEGKAVMGDYILSEADGRIQKGIADGKWMG